MDGTMHTFEGGLGSRSPEAGRVLTRELELRAGDGHPLAATVFEPSGDGSGDVVLVASSMGLTRQLYEPFGRFLAARGWIGVTFDYRGIGGSRRRPAARSSASMRDWGEKDLPGVLEWIGGRYRPRRLVLVAHSIGGQVIGFAPNHHRVDAMVMVASQKVHWSYWPWPRRVAVRAAHLALPAFLRLFKRFPGWIFDCEELTAQMVLDWWRWAAQPGYPTENGVCLDERFRGFTAPILALSFADDPVWSPPRSVEALLELYASAPSAHWHILPRPFGVETIGHSGFFLEDVGPRLWEPVVGWLEQRGWPPSPGELPPDGVLVCSGGAEEPWSRSWSEPWSKPAPSAWSGGGGAPPGRAAGASGRGAGASLHGERSPG